MVYMDVIGVGDPAYVVGIVYMRPREFRRTPASRNIQKSMINI